MVAELGNFALILALILALFQSVLPLVGAQTGSRRLMRSGRFLASGQFVFLAIAYGVLTWAFLANDFSVRYVASHSALSQPLMYKITAVWGGHEGSLLLWVLILGLWGVAVARFSRALPREMLARVLAGLCWYLLLVFAYRYAKPRFLGWPRGFKQPSPCQVIG